jgi:hypothetical protein
MTEVKEMSDTNLLDNILNIGKSRERKVYYHKDGTPTKPLPADPYSLIYYMKKGLSVDNPVEEKEPEKIKCPYCDFTPENALGLRTHLSKHVNESKNKEETE